MNSYQLAHATARRHAAETTSQLAAARALRLGGTAGKLPRGYHGDSQIPDPLSMQVEPIIPQPELLHGSSATRSSLLLQ